MAAHRLSQQHNPATVLIMSFTFYPSAEIGARRTTALARFLASRGIRVLVVSAFGDQAVTPGSEIFPGVIAVPVRRPQRRWLDLLVTLKRRVMWRGAGRGAEQAGIPQDGASIGSARASLPTRLREQYFRFVYFIDQFKNWSWYASRTAVRAGREHRAALMLVSAPPHSTLLAGARAARRLGIPFIADMRDPWSDAFAGAYPQRRMELRVLRTLERRVMEQAAAVTSTSAAAAALLIARDPGLARRTHVIRNGFDGELAPAVARTGGRLSILYAGALYLRRTPYPLLAALERLLSHPGVDPDRVQLTFMGDKDGTFSDQSLGRWLQGKRCAAVVRIVPRQAAETVVQETERATVLLNLAQQQHLQVPAKTFEQLAAGREVLVICEEQSETARVTAGIRGVTRVDQSDPDILDAVLLDLYHRHVITGTACVPSESDVRRFSRALANERFAHVLSAIAPLPATHLLPEASGRVASSLDGAAY